MFSFVPWGSRGLFHPPHPREQQKRKAMQGRGSMLAQRFRPQDQTMAPFIRRRIRMTSLEAESPSGVLFSTYGVTIVTCVGDQISDAGTECKSQNIRSTHSFLWHCLQGGGAEGVTSFLEDGSLIHPKCVYFFVAFMPCLGIMCNIYIFWTNILKFQRGQFYIFVSLISRNLRVKKITTYR